MTEKEKTAILEGIKNGIRSVWFAVLPVILTGIDTKKGEFNINWMVVLATGVVALITVIDGVMYETGKLKKNKLLKKGLSFGV